MPKAKVLPVPVCAIPTMSLPSKAAGIHWCCMGVGVLNRIRFKTSSNSGAIPNSLKLDEVWLVCIIRCATIAHFEGFVNSWVISKCFDVSILLYLKNNRMRQVAVTATVVEDKFGQTDFTAVFGHFGNNAFLFYITGSDVLRDRHSRAINLVCNAPAGCLKIALRRVCFKRPIFQH